MNRHASRLLCSMVVLTVLAGCTDQGEPTAAPGASEPEAATPSIPASSPPTGPAVALDSGVQVVVTDVVAGETGVQVSYQGFNGSVEPVEFASTEPLLEDNAQNEYVYVPSETNAAILTGTGQIARVTLRFELDQEVAPDEQTPAPGSRFHLRLNRHESAWAPAEFRELTPSG